MGAAVKTFQKMFAVAKATVGVAGGLFRGKGPKKSRGGKRYNAREYAQQGGSFSPGFGGTEKQKGADGEQLGGGKS